MGSRPIIAGSAIFVRANRATPVFQCQRSIHLHRAVISAACPGVQYRKSRSQTSPSHTSYTSRYSVRYASSSAASIPARKPSAVPAKTHKRLPPTATKPSPAPNKTLTATTRLNPPDHTYAPELNVPARAPGQSYPGYLFQAGRAYLTFYKSGITHVRRTAKEAKALRTQKKESALSRAEWQIIRRSRRDMLRLAPFGLLVLIMGEWLPLVALYLTPVIPEPCRIPAQVQRDLAKRERRRSDRERRVGIDAARLSAKDRTAGSALLSSSSSSSSIDVSKPQHLKGEDVEKLDLYHLLRVSARLDCHAHVWDRVFVTPPKWLVRRNVGSYLAYLRKDDGLIERDGGWQGLGKREVERACVERGFSVLGKSEVELKKALQEWFRE